MSRLLCLEGRELLLAESIDPAGCGSSGGRELRVSVRGRASRWTQADRLRRSGELTRASPRGKRRNESKSKPQASRRRALQAHIPELCRIVETFSVHEQQRAALQRHFDTFAREARALGLGDQQVAEWLLSLAGRWLHAHGVSKESCLQFLALCIRKPVILPVTAEARSRNDFGGLR